MAGAGVRAGVGTRMTHEIDLTSRAVYTYFEAEKLRFSDTDMVGHVNNVAFAALLESGRTAFGQVHLHPHMPGGVLIVMARVEIDYRRELHWPATVDIGNRIVAIGRSSYAIGQGIFRGEKCFTTGRTTLVMINRETRKPSPLPDNFRAVLEALAT
jgi:acyl-CoA thioester hydrolase